MEIPDRILRNRAIIVGAESVSALKILHTARAWIVLLLLGACRFERLKQLRHIHILHFQRGNLYLGEFIPDNDVEWFAHGFLDRRHELFWRATGKIEIEFGQFRCALALALAGQSERARR